MPASTGPRFPVPDYISVPRVAGVGRRLRPHPNGCIVPRQAPPGPSQRQPFTDAEARIEGRAWGEGGRHAVRRLICSTDDFGRPHDRVASAPGRNQRDLLRHRPIVRDVRTGRFERSLAALTAAGALVTAAEIYFRAPTAPVSRRRDDVAASRAWPRGRGGGRQQILQPPMAKTALPVCLAAIVANGLQVYLPCQGDLAEAGGSSRDTRTTWRSGRARSCPAAGDDGRRHGAGRRSVAPRAVTRRATGRFPDFDVLSQAWHSDTRDGVLDEAKDRPPPEPRLAGGGRHPRPRCSMS